MGRAVRLALGTATRLVIVVILLVTLPMSLLGFAASGSTLGNPADGWRVGGLFLAYGLADVVALILLTLIPTRKLPWLFAAALSTLPIAVFGILPYLQASH